MTWRAVCGSPWLVAAGQVNYLQRIVLNVDKDLFDDEMYFWKNAMNMRVTRVETGGDGRRSVFFAFGQAGPHTCSSDWLFIVHRYTAAAAVAAPALLVVTQGLLQVLCSYS